MVKKEEAPSMNFREDYNIRYIPNKLK